MNGTSKKSGIADEQVNGDSAFLTRKKVDSGEGAFIVEKHIKCC